MGDELYKDLLKQEIPKDVEKKKNYIAEQLLNTVVNNKYFKTSNPKIDLDYINCLMEIYDIGEIREELKKMNLWLISNPGREKKNYRKFITNWLSKKQQKIYIDR